jgi:hypothetical protein
MLSHLGKLLTLLSLGLQKCKQQSAARKHPSWTWAEFPCKCVSILPAVTAALLTLTKLNLFFMVY